MKIKKIFMSCLLLAGVLNASAQEQYPKTVYDHNPYWYVQLQGGAQYTLGEIDFKDLISPNVQVSIGRQFNPVFGARLSVNAWQSRAGIEFNDEVKGSVIAPAGTTKWKWMYVAPGLDATFNLSNLFCGFNPNRIFNFSVFAGLGANIGWDFNKDSNWENANLIAAHYPYMLLSGTQPENISYAWEGTKVRLYGRAGVAADFKLSDAVSIGLEVNANTLSDRYNGKKANNWDWYFNALAGVKINLGKTYSTRIIEAPKVPEKVIEKVTERIIEKPCPQVVEAPKVASDKQEEEKYSFRREIFYPKVNQNWVQKSEVHKVKEVADYMKEHPDCTVEITGYADKGSGGHGATNDRLSKARAERVKQMLIRNYKIAASRIKTDYKGSSVQPFAQNEKNRVAIAIVE
jgi:outer membrane protein OmpA-like peptidoglycan-associated protein